MRWASQVVAVAALLALSGCAVTDFDVVLFRTEPRPYERVLTGPLEKVAHTAQQALTRLDLAAEARPEGEGVNIYSETASGAKFRLALSRTTSLVGEKTRIKLEWLGTLEDRSVTQILAEVERLGTIQKDGK